MIDAATKDTEEENSEGSEGSQIRDSSKNEKHGDGGRAKSKAERDIEALEAKKEGTTHAEREAIDTKIRNIMQTAEKKKLKEKNIVEVIKDKNYEKIIIHSK